MTGQAEALRYAVRFRVLTKYLGQICTDYRRSDNETLKDLEERWEPKHSLKAP